MGTQILKKLEGYQERKESSTIFNKNVKIEIRKFKHELTYNNKMLLMFLSPLHLLCSCEVTLNSCREKQVCFFPLTKIKND